MESLSSVRKESNVRKTCRALQAGKVKHYLNWRRIVVEHSIVVLLSKYTVKNQAHLKKNYKCHKLLFYDHWLLLLNPIQKKKQSKVKIMPWPSAKNLLSKVYKSWQLLNQKRFIQFRSSLYFTGVKTITVLIEKNGKGGAKFKSRQKWAIVIFTPPPFFFVHRSYVYCRKQTPSNIVPFIISNSHQKIGFAQKEEKDK